MFRRASILSVVLLALAQTCSASNGVVESLTASIPTSGEHDGLMTPPKHGLTPVLFFHGLSSSADESAPNLKATFAAEGRKFVAFNFCTVECTLNSLNSQVDQAIAAIHEEVGKDPEAFANGYIIMGHSMGGILARGVIEAMDDHNAVSFISLVSPQTGLAYGPQAIDAIPAQIFAEVILPASITVDQFNYTQYGADDYASGKFQSALSDFILSNPKLQDERSIMNLVRLPRREEWRKVNKYLSPISNLNPCSDDECRAAQDKRRANFLKLKSAHFFTSPDDGVLSPWQSGILGKYTDFEEGADYVAEFPKLKIEDMEDTDEYKTYGLKELDDRGGLYTYTVSKVPHPCWLMDVSGTIEADSCYYQATFDENIHPVLKAIDADA